MAEVKLWRLYALRAAYLMIAAGLGVQVWPGIMHHDKPWELMQGVVECVLAGVSILAIIGLRYPLLMLPLLLFEIVWKSIWLGVVARPLWLAGTMDEGTASTAAACLVAAVFPLVIPWRYVLANFVLRPGDRWF